MLLGNKDFKSILSYYLKDFDVYLHEKGQFWPRPGLNTYIGQSEVIRLQRGIESIGQFEYGRVEMIPNHGYCIDKKEYSFTKCMKDFIERKANCKINWNKDTSEEDTCQENINLDDHKNLLDFLKHSSTSNLTEVTGCLSKCSHI